MTEHSEEELVPDSCPTSPNYDSEEIPIEVELDNDNDVDVENYGGNEDSDTDNRLLNSSQHSMSEASLNSTLTLSGRWSSSQNSLDSSNLVSESHDEEGEDIFSADELGAIDRSIDDVGDTSYLDNINGDEFGDNATENIEQSETRDNDESDIDVSDADSDELNDEAGIPEGDLEKYKPIWTDNLTEIYVAPFNQPQGMRLPRNFDTATSTPIDYFKLFWKDELFSEIEENTNKYVQWVEDQRRQMGERGYRDKRWYNTNQREMKAWLGMNIMFGLNPAARLPDYWSRDEYLGNEGIKKIMPFNRFVKLNQYLHVNDRSVEFPRGHPQRDELAKVRKIIDTLTETFKRYRHPSKFMSIDEGMIKFKGRVRFLQYMPDKPSKRGIKLWIRCDAITGYCFQFEVYLGKPPGKVPKFGAMFHVIDSLTKELRGKNYRLFFDNAYTTVPLMIHLFGHKLYACATVQTNRKFLHPQIVKKPGKVDRGWYLTVQDTVHKNLTLTVWKDTSVVRFLSTMSQPHIPAKTVRRIGHELKTVSQPMSGHQYNRFMGGVDRFDQKRSSYTCGRCSKKVWKYIFFFLLEASIVNAWLCYRECSTRSIGRKKFTQFDFRHELATQLIDSYSSRKRAAKAKLDIGKRRSDHANDYMGGTKRRCRGHPMFKPDGKKRRTTVYGCKLCKIHLCKQCHAAYHLK